MKGNQFYTVFGIVAAVLVGAAGFYAYSGHSAYKDAGGGFETRRTNLQRLKKSEPYPNEENLKRIEKEVSDYEGEIKGLFQILDRFQQPLNTNIESREFFTALKDRYGNYVALAKKKGMKIANEKEFYMGMNAYKVDLPDTEDVPLLDYQLGAIEYLLNMLVEEGATALIGLDRELLPVELATSGAKTDTPADSSAVAARYPVNLTFEANHPAFQSIVNKITNDDKYFFILRALRVDNSEKEGATKGAGEEEGPRYVNADGQEAPRDLLAEMPKDLDVPARVAWMRANGGYELQSSDARILLGNESLRVFMVIDLVRFADPTKKSAVTEGKGKKAKAKGAGTREKKK